MFGLLQWALNVVLATIFLLLFAIVLWFLWNAVMGVFHGPHLDYGIVAILVAIVAVGVDNYRMAHRQVQA